MRASLIVALVALVLAMGLGMAGQSRSAASRAADELRPAPAAWYASLPRDPEKATAAYLDRVPPVMRERGEAVSRSRYWALAGRIAAGLGAILMLLYSGAASALDAMTARRILYPWLRDFVFALALLAYAFVVTLPVEVWASFIRYRAFGFSEQPFAGWLQNYAIGWASTAVFYAVGLVALMALIRRMPRTWFVWAGAVYLALALIYTIATPSLIEPLTDSYTPLPNSALKREILVQAHVAGVPADNVYTDDASRQSRRLNGHVSGTFGTARITIDDTALASPPSEVKALAAHEMGHYAMGHPFEMVLMASLIATFGFSLIAWLEPPLLRRAGRRWGLASATQTGSIAVIWLLFTAWGFISEPLTNVYARVQEAQADAFSLDLAREPLGLADFMIQDADIARLNPTTLDLILFYDHPSDVARVHHAMQWRAARAAAQLEGSVQRR